MQSHTRTAAVLHVYGILLLSLYSETADKGVTDRLDNPELFDLLKCHPLEDITGCHPTGCLSLWIEEDQIASMELTEGDSVRIKTRGDGPFIGK